MKKLMGAVKSFMLMSLIAVILIVVGVMVYKIYTKKKKEKLDRENRMNGVPVVRDSSGEVQVRPNTTLWIVIAVAYTVLPFDLINDSLISFFGLGIYDDIGVIITAIIKVLKALQYDKKLETLMRSSINNIDMIISNPNPKSNKTSYNRMPTERDDRPDYDSVRGFGEYSPMPARNSRNPNNKDIIDAEFRDN